LEKRAKVVRHEWKHENQAATRLLKGLEKRNNRASFGSVEYSGLTDSIVGRRHKGRSGDLECYCRIRIGAVCPWIRVDSAEDLREETITVVGSMGIAPYGSPGIGYIWEDMLILMVILECCCRSRHSIFEKMNGFRYKLVILCLFVDCTQL
jgi:hypothetical protein